MLFPGRVKLRLYWERVLSHGQGTEGWWGWGRGWMREKTVIILAEPGLFPIGIKYIQ